MICNEDARVIEMIVSNFLWLLRYIQFQKAFRTLP